MNELYIHFDDWKIVDTNGNEVIGKQKRVLKKAISDKKVVDIEEKFSTYLENNWYGFKKDLEERIELSNDSLAIDYPLFMKYFYMFDLRSTYGNEVERKLLDKLISLIKNTDTIPEKERILYMMIQ